MLEHIKKLYPNFAIKIISTTKRIGISVLSYDTFFPKPFCKQFSGFLTHPYYILGTKEQWDRVSLIPSSNYLPGGGLFLTKATALANEGMLNEAIKITASGVFPAPEYYQLKAYIDRSVSRDTKLWNLVTVSHQNDCVNVYRDNILIMQFQNDGKIIMHPSVWQFDTKLINSLLPKYVKVVSNALGIHINTNKLYKINTATTIVIMPDGTVEGEGIEANPNTIIYNSKLRKAYFVTSNHYFDLDNHDTLYWLNQLQSKAYILANNKLYSTYPNHLFSIIFKREVQSILQDKPTDLKLDLTELKKLV